jgi:hypothetical protein
MASQDSNSQDKPKRRVPLGEPLTAEELARRVGTGETAGEVLDAEELWQERAPTYAKKWLKAKKSERPPQ